jgi:hypothetical protein
MRHILSWIFVGVAVRVLTPYVATGFHNVFSAFH